MIPRVIHQIWIGPKKRPWHWMRTWPSLNPGFRYELWDDDRCASVKWQNDDLIRQIPEWAGKADLLRYEILLNHGGIFIDADAECVKPLEEEVFCAPSAWASWESEDARPGLIANGYLGMEKGHFLGEALVKNARFRGDLTKARAWVTVGTAYLTQIVDFYGFRSCERPIKLFPSHYFIPRHYTGATEYNGTGSVYAKQHWGSTLHLYEEGA